jgi:secretion/DNA translocation related TadE-like protein
MRRGRCRRSARPSNPFPPEAGSVSVVAAGILVVASVLSLASVDLLRAVQAQSQCQAAADSAALAAAQELAIPSDEGTPAQAAAAYAAANGAELVSCSCEPGAAEALVDVRMPVPLVFVGPDRTVTARARAVVGSG